MMNCNEWMSELNKPNTKVDPGFLLAPFPMTTASEKPTATPVALSTDNAEVTETTTIKTEASTTSSPAVAATTAAPAVNPFAAMMGASSAASKNDKEEEEGDDDDVRL